MKPNNFEYSLRTHLIFGKNVLLKSLQKYIQENSSILVHVNNKNSEWLKKHLDDLSILFKQKKCTIFYSYSNKLKNDFVIINNSIDATRNTKIDLIIAIGGGSTIDRAKVMSMLINSGKSSIIFKTASLDGLKFIPLIAICTRPGSGSETSPASVICDYSDNKEFVDREHLNLFPYVSIIDYELMNNLTKRQLVIGLLDATVHILERLCSKNIVGFQNLLLGSQLKSILSLMNEIYLSENYVDLIPSIALITQKSHDNWLGTGRQQEWTSHIISNAINPYLNDFEHGHLVSLVFTKWFEYVYKKEKSLLNNIFSSAGFADDFFKFIINTIQISYDRFELKNKLSSADINIINHNSDLIKNKISRRNKSGTIGNILRLTADDIYQIFFK